MGDDIQEKIEEAKKIATLENEIKHLKSEFEKLNITFCNMMGELKFKLDDFITRNLDRPYCAEQRKDCQSGFTGIYDEIERLEEKLSKKIRDSRDSMESKIAQIQDQRTKDMENYISKGHAFGYGLLTTIITILLTVLTMNYIGG